MEEELEKTKAQLAESAAALQTETETRQRQEVQLAERQGELDQLRDDVQRDADQMRADAQSMREEGAAQAAAIEKVLQQAKQQALVYEAETKEEVR